MEYFTNHCWCSQSNWDNEFFDAQHLVTVDKEIDTDFVTLFKEIVNEKQELLWDSSHFDQLKEGPIPLPEELRYETYVSKERTRQLNENVFNWLLENVKDYKGEKGWCVGNDEYNSNCHYQERFTIFFKRRKDAFAFVKQWSKYKKFTQQVNYFKDTRKDLDFETNRYVLSDR